MSRIAAAELESRYDDAWRGSDGSPCNLLRRVFCRLWLVLAFTCGVSGFAFDQPFGEDDDGDREFVSGGSSGVMLAPQHDPLRHPVSQVPQIRLLAAVLQPALWWCAALSAQHPANRSRSPVFQRIVSTSL